MNLLAFWARAILKRIVEIVKISPVITIGGIIIISALLYTNTNIQLTFDFARFMTACSVLIIIAIIMSLKEYNVLEKITFYAKSSHSNQKLRHIFFMKRSLLNNVFMILFFISIFSKRIILDFPFSAWKILCVFPFSVFL